MPKVRLLLVQVRPDIAAQWHPALNTADLSRVGTGSHRVAHWLCSAGHTWRAPVFSRCQGVGCPQCAGYVSVSGASFLDRCPDLLDQWDHQRNEGLDPRQVGPGSHRRVWWRCLEGHAWQAEVANRARGGGRCAQCPKDSSSPTLAAYPELLEQFDVQAHPGLDASALRASSNRKLWWRCPHGHSWRAQIRHRALASSGCPHCAHRQVRPDLASNRPDLALQWHPDLNGRHRPETVTVGSMRWIWWTCPTCTHPYRARVLHRVRGNSRCPTCTLSRSSHQEIRLFAELEHVLGAGTHADTLSTPHGRWSLDMTFPGPNNATVAVEFDGSYWHQGREDIDLGKSVDVERHSAGTWTVVRVREEPLARTRPSDVIVPHLCAADHAARILLRHLRELLAWPPATLERIDHYLRQDEPCAQQRADQILQERTPAPPEQQSLGRLPNSTASLDEPGP